MNRMMQQTLSLTCAASLLFMLGVTDVAAKTKAKTKTTAVATAPYDIQYNADKKAASERYSDDKKLCDEEKSSSTRMQCKRDANSEYKKALTTAKTRYDSAKKAAATAAKAPTAAASPATAPAASNAAICNECGKVIAVKTGEKQGTGGPLGVIAGGVAGAVLGHQVGGGAGKDLATIAGAAGGAYAGHKIEEKMKATRYWAVSVRFENGEERSFEFAQEPGFAVGDAVKTADKSIVPR